VRAVRNIQRVGRKGVSPGKVTRKCRNWSRSNDRGERRATETTEFTNGETELTEDERRLNTLATYC